MQTEQITALELFEKGLSKSEIKTMAENAVNSVLEVGNPLQVAEAISAMEQFIKEVKDNPSFKDYVREETAKYPKGFVAPSGAKIETIEAGVKYDYSKCGDITWGMMDADMKALKEKIADREKFLKALPIEGMSVLSEETGEVSTIYPPSKTSVSTYKITLAK